MQKTIGIFGFPSCKDQWDPESSKTGLYGADEALLYMSKSLADLGYKVYVFANPPPNSVHSLPEANPRYVPFNAKIDGGQFDIAISWRMPAISKFLKKYAKKVYFWPHDAYPCTHITQDEIDAYDDIFWISESLRNQFISVHPGFKKFTNVFGNGIVTEQFNPIKERENPYSCIYATTWIRGLEILLDVWPEVKQKFPKATLDIYYGSKGLPIELEKKLKQKISQLEDVVDRGLVGHEEITRAYEKTSFWTYPCSYFETFCISALKAQLAGAVPVIIDGSALSETVRHGYKCLTKEEYLPTLLKAMGDAEKISLADRKKMGEFILNEFTWEKVAIKWKEIFDQHLLLENSNKKENKSIEQSSLEDAKILEKAIQNDPTNRTYIFHLALDCVLGKQYSLALHFFKRRVFLGGGDWKEYYISLFQIKKLEERIGISSKIDAEKYAKIMNDLAKKKSETILWNLIELIKINEFVLGYFLSQLALSLPNSNKEHEQLFLHQFARCAHEIGKKEEIIETIKNFPSHLSSEIEKKYLM